ncbi:MAG: YceD family protein [Desulfovibrio sp.]|nr:YceD family protein [Desulfovibrio sp.]
MTHPDYDQKMRAFAHVPVNRLPPQGAGFILDEQALWLERIAAFGMDCAVTGPLRAELTVLPAGIRAESVFGGAGKGRAGKGGATRDFGHPGDEDAEEAVGGCLVRGRLTGEVVLPCKRCAEDARVSISADFEEFEPLGSGSLAEESRIFLEDGQPVLDLDALCWEEFLLALPESPLCRPDCKGVCPGCGTNLNEGRCACAEPAPDPRLAVLRAIRIPPRGRSQQTNNTASQERRQDAETQEATRMAHLLSTIPRVLLMGPGPSLVNEAVYTAMTTPLLGHMDAEFIALMNAIKAQLRAVCGTANEVTMPMSGTGSAGMEACFVNLVEKGDKALILQNGVFGARMADVASRLGADVDVLEFAWGTPVVPEKVKERLAQKAYAIVGIVHAETSTGVENPVEEVGALVRENGALYLVDSVTGLGGIEVAVDKWGVDAFYSGTQKCLSCPPGLAPLSFSKRAMAKLNARKSKVPNWYLDISLLTKYWEGQTRVYHHTAPISMNYALYQALALILEDGLPKVFARHRAAHEMLVAGLEDLGFTMFVKKPCRLPMLNLVVPPDGVDEAGLRGKLRAKHYIELGSGLGPLAGKVIRIGLMGETARQEHVERLLTALRAEL